MGQGHSEGLDSNTIRGLSLQTQEERATRERRWSRGLEQRLRGRELENRLAQRASTRDDHICWNGEGSTVTGSIPWTESPRSTAHLVPDTVRDSIGSCIQSIVF